MEAGAAACGNKPKSVQNCKAAHSEATAAPQWIAHVKSGKFLRVRLFIPTNTNRLNKNHRMASTPARYVCDQIMLPNAYKISIKGRSNKPCHRRLAFWPRNCQKKAIAAANMPNAAMADLSVSCNISSLGTPTAGSINIMSARIKTGRDSPARCRIVG